MKKFLILIFMMAFVGTMSMNAQKVYSKVIPLDTLTCAAAADTSTYEVDKKLNYAGYIQYTCVADSLSGATGATIYVETAPEYPLTDEDWTMVASSVIDGVQTKYLYQAKLYTPKIRFRVIAPSSTQSTRLAQTYSFKADR